VGQVRVGDESHEAHRATVRGQPRAPQHLVHAVVGLASDHERSVRDAGLPEPPIGQEQPLQVLSPVEPAQREQEARHQAVAREHPGCLLGRPRAKTRGGAQRNDGHLAGRHAVPRLDVAAHELRARDHSRGARDAPRDEHAQREPEGGGERRRQVQEPQIVDGDHQRAPPAERARILHMQAIDARPCSRAPERQRDAQDTGPLAHADGPRAGPRRQPAVERVGGVRREEREGMVALLRVQGRDQVPGIGGVSLTVGLGTVRINADPNWRGSHGSSIHETVANGNLVDQAAELGDLVPPRWIGPPPVSHGAAAARSPGGS
jgi:hypothetical protein